TGEICPSTRSSLQYGLRSASRSGRPRTAPGGRIQDPETHGLPDLSSLTQISPARLDLDAIRRKLESAKGPQYWNSLEALAETDEFRRFVDDEFPNREMDWADPSKRRTFLKVMGASLALAGLGACTRQPFETIVPYVKQPEEFIPGKPLFYATAMPA